MARVLVGRGAELRQLREALAAALDGTGRPVFVTGEPGIGKSALVERFARHAAEVGVVVHVAPCIEVGGAPPLWPFTSLLRDVTRGDLTDRLDSSAGYAVALLAPDRTPGAVESSALEDQLASEENRFRLFDGCRRAFDAAAEAAPRLLVVEDAHAADAESLRLLRFVVQAGHRSPYILVVTSRDGAAWDRVDAALGDAVAAVDLIALGPLSEHAVAEVAAHHVGEPPPRETAHALHDATGGNPLFVRSLVQHLARAGRLRSFGSGDPVPVPGTLRGILEARFSQLPDDVVEDLATLATAGRDIDRVLGTLLIGGRIDAVLEVGRREGLLEGDAREERFAHALVRAALMERLPPDARHHIHRRIGEALEAVEGDPRVRLAALAHHFAHAGPEAADKAFVYAQAAAIDARRVGAFAHAVHHFEQALEAGARAGAPATERAATLAALAEARLRSGDVEGGRAAARQGWDLARRSGDAVSMAHAALAYATFAVGGVVDEEVVRLVGGALASIGPDHPGLRARLRGRLAAEVAYSAPEAAREALVREAVEEARATGEPRVIFETLRSADRALSTPERVAAALEWATEAVAAADAMDDLAAKAEAHAVRAIHHLASGDAGGYGSDVRALQQLVTLVPTPLNAWYVAVAAGCRALLDGRFDDARIHIDDSLAYSSAVPNAVVSWQFQQFSLAWERGDIGSFEPVLRSLIDARPAGAPMLRSALVLVHASCGRHEEADASLPIVMVEVMERHQPHLWLLSIGWLAEAAHVTGNAAMAAALLDVLAPFDGLHVVGSTGTVAAYWGSVRRHLGNLGAVLGDHDAAVAHAEAALAAHTRVGAVPFIARSQYDLARALQERSDGGDVTRAATLVREARSTAERVGMTRLLAELDTAAPAPQPADEAGPGDAPRLVLEGEYWTLMHEGRVTRLRDSKGVRYLAALLARPDHERHVLDLAGRPSGEGTRIDDGSGDAVLDERARELYARRLRELEREIGRADADADLGRASSLREEWDFLLDELQRATGLGGTPRTLGTSAGESARVAVTKAVRGVLKKIESADPTLGRHFRATIRTGAFCSYTSDTEPCLEWRIDH